MQKIPSLFMRNYDGDRLVRDEVVPGSEWVINGEGVPTVKIDGTSCLIRDGRLYKRYDVKKGRTPPAGFEPAQDADPVTGHWPGWVPVSDTDPSDRWHREALESGHYPDGTYELIGPRVQGNPHEMPHHTLIPHGRQRAAECERTFDGIREYLRRMPIMEGIVWHHPDGRMVKIKRKDFGLPWPVKR